MRLRLSDWHNADVQGVCGHFKGWQDWQETDRVVMADVRCKMWIAIHVLLLAICSSVLAVLVENSLENFQNSVTNLRNSLENFLSLQLIRTSRSLRRMLSVCCQSWQSAEWLQTLCTSWFCQSDSLGSENSTVITKIYRNGEYLYAGAQLMADVWWKM